MELTGHACTEAMNEAEEAERRERSEDNAGGVRVELRVRRLEVFCSTNSSFSDLRNQRGDCHCCHGRQGNGNQPAICRVVPRDE